MKPPFLMRFWLFVDFRETLFQIQLSEYGLGIRVVEDIHLQQSADDP